MEKEKQNLKSSDSPKNISPSATPVVVKNKNIADKNQANVSKTSFNRRENSESITNTSHLREEIPDKRITLYRITLFIVSIQALISIILGFSSKKYYISYVIFLIIIDFFVFTLTFFEFIVRILKQYNKLPATIRNYHFIITTLTIISTLCIVSGSLTVSIFKKDSNILVVAGSFTLTNGIILFIQFVVILFKVIKNVILFYYI